MFRHTWTGIRKIIALLADDPASAQQFFLYLLPMLGLILAVVGIAVGSYVLGAITFVLSVPCFIFMWRPLKDLAWRIALQFRSAFPGGDIYSIRTCGPRDAARINDTLRRALPDGFEPEGLTPVEVLRQWLAPGQALIRAIERGNSCIGFYAVFPLKHQAYERLLSGELEFGDFAAGDMAAVDFVSGMVTPPCADPMTLFILDFEVVRESGSGRQMAITYLLADLVLACRDLLMKNPQIATATALIATRPGKHFAERFGFVQDAEYEQAASWARDSWYLYRAARDEMNALAGALAPDPRLEPCRGQAYAVDAGARAALLDVYKTLNQARKKPRTAAPLPGA